MSLKHTGYLFCIRMSFTPIELQLDEGISLMIQYFLFSFGEQKHLHIRFVGEPAVDEGSPRREFFMLLMNAISNNSMLLHGPPDRRLLRHNTSAFQVNLCTCNAVS